MVKKLFSGGYVFLILMILYAPILLLVVYSFNMSREIGIWSTEWGFSLYGELFKNADIMATVVNTFILAIVSSVLSTILGTLGAIGMFYSKQKTRKILNGATQIPIINAEIVTAISIALVCTMFAFGRSYASLLIGHVVLTFPFVVLSVMPRLQQMDNNLYEAALDLGATPTKALFTVIIPEVMPGIMSGFLLAINLSLDDYIITTFTKPATFDTISTYVFDAYARGGKSSSVPALRALSTLIFIVMIAFVVIRYIISNNKAKKERR